MVLEDPNFSITRVNGMVVESLLSLNLLMNSNSYVIFFCDSNVLVTITASQKKTMIWDMPRQPTIPSLRKSALLGPGKMNFVVHRLGRSLTLPCANHLV